MLQIKNGAAVISAEDLAILFGRKHLSVVRAIDAIPAYCLRKNMFLITDGEVFLTSKGVLRLDMSKRHDNMCERIWEELSLLQRDYKAFREAEFLTGKPPKVIIKACIQIEKLGLPAAALMVFKTACWFKGYNPARTLNTPKKSY